MFDLTSRDYATMILDSGTLILIFGIISTSFRHREKGRPDEDSFLVLLVMNIFMAVGDTIGYLCEGKTFLYIRQLSTLGMTIFYLSFVTASMAWLHYCRIRFSNGTLRDRSHFAYEYLPGVIMTALVVINAFTGWIFSYDENASYHRGVLFIPMYIIVTFYVIAGFITLSRYRDKSSGKVLIPVWVYSIPMVWGVIFTFLIPNSASFAPIGVAMSFTFTHMGTINEVSESYYFQRRRLFP